MARRRPAVGSRTRHQATPVPRPLPAEWDLQELREPEGLPFPDDRWPLGRPEYVIVLDQLRGRQPGRALSLAELLETAQASAREPEADMEAEP